MTGAFAGQMNDPHQKKVNMFGALTRKKKEVSKIFDKLSLFKPSDCLALRAIKLKGKSQRKRIRSTRGGNLNE